MNLTLPTLAIGLLLCLPAQAAAPQPLKLAASNNNPYNSPIQRANPNSRQGSMSATRRCVGLRPSPSSARPVWTTVASATATTCGASSRHPTWNPLGLHATPNACPEPLERNCA